ncbi:nicotinate-nucleotide--dimethylbenzimidazole phosphoribosyltransferase [Streptomyces indicus]|uniref:Nicotinate-nucleotide--dimethylbenzimidazole phosphoribosyltransferase n=1 Tax=Streptomyces indicus TaxID=417292 RepID=A0A1G8XHN0_9ACTN|nr:nicotinate-nucleotide--dimethylbenzimidazole phosphoribosyltransferase [Streptomyces indicus]SDJ90109.1 nicotinate-nucleotide--dimethylbenzimidazole phosphoribosyltransferase [Streptomyces indicus]
MTDTGQVPGEGLPQDAGTVGRPGVPAPDAHTFHDPSATGTEDDDLLLMPGAQGAWTEDRQAFAPEGYETPGAQTYGTPQAQMPQAQVPQAQVPHGAQQGFVPADQGYAQAGPADHGYEPSAPADPAAPTQDPGAHEAAGRDSGFVDLGGARTPAAQETPAAKETPARRPLHMGPPSAPATPSPVRSLADRGPAGTPANPAPMRRSGPPTTGPEYLDIPRDAGASAPAGAQGAGAQADAAAGLPGPQLGEIPAQAATPWPQAPQAQGAETVVPQARPAGATPAAPDAEAFRAAQEAAGFPVVPAPQGAALLGVPAHAGAASALPGAAFSEAAAQYAAHGGEPAQGPVAPVPGEGFHAAAGPQLHLGPMQSAGAAVSAGSGAPEGAEASGGAPVPADAGAHGGEPHTPAAPIPMPAASAEQLQGGEAGAAVPAGLNPQDPGPIGEFVPVDGVVPSTPHLAPTPPQPLRLPQEPGVPGEASAMQGEGAVTAGQEQVASAQAHAAAAVQDQAAVMQEAGVLAQASAVPVQEGGTPEQAQTQMPGVPVQETAVSAQQGTAAEAEAALSVPAPREGEPQHLGAPEAPVAEQPEAGTVAGPEPVVAESAEPALSEEATPVDPAAAAAPADAEQVADSAQPDADSAQPAAEAARTDAEADPTAEALAEAAPTTEGAAATETGPETEAAPVASEATPAEGLAETAQATETPQVTETAKAADPIEDPQPEPEPAAANATPQAAPAPAADETAAGTDDETATDQPVAAEEQEEEPELLQFAEDLDTPENADLDDRAEAYATADGPAAPGYADAEREAVLRVMRERRDIRNGFRSDPIPHEVLLRVLEAAHTAPSVGHSQPWDFVVIRSADTRRTMHELAMRQRDAYAKSLPKGRAKQFKELKIEAILETPVNIVVTADPTRGGRHTLGRHTQPQMAPYSSALAVENLWLAARAEGLGVGWVSFFDEREMVRTLGLPEHLEVVAYLCVGYVDEFPAEPELMQAGWSKRRPLSWVVHEETYGRRALPGEDPHDLLAETVANIRPLDAKALGEAWERQKRMTKPAGALGMLEIISAQLAGLSRMCPPPIPEPAAVAIFAGDHGVHAQGVTPWPQEVTGQMVANFLGGGAVCNAFANQVGAEVCVIDVGVASDLPATPGLLPRKVRAGTADMTTGPALTREEVKAAIEVGIETARDLVAAGNKALLTGEMGIANTTASAALISVFTGADPSEVTGRGTGINDETLARKTDVVRRALELHQPDPADPIGVLAAIGGLEHAAIVGLLLGGASLRTPVILDGVSAGAAALVARAIAPEVLAACIAGHRSAEPGHVAALNKLGLRPLVDLDLRLGEGTGALLALPVVQSAARAMHEVATFDSAGVTEK